MSSLLIELHFLPAIEYFCALQSFDEIILERQENFVKQTFRSRCHILGSGGTSRLIIPLVAEHRKTPITDVRIDYNSRWHVTMWRTVESAYAKAPFFEHYAGDLKAELFAQHETLYTLNRNLLSMCLKWLRWQKQISESVAYEKTVPAGVLDMRNVISAKKDFRDREIYRPAPYQQVFGSNFAPNLSLIDLVFCEGPNATALIKASQKNLNK